MPHDLVEPLYTIENSTWSNTMNFIRPVLKNESDSMWMHDLVRMLGKKIKLADTGDWSVV